MYKLIQQLQPALPGFFCMLPEPGIPDFPMEASVVPGEGGFIKKSLPGTLQLHQFLHETSMVFHFDIQQVKTGNYRRDIKRGI